jgi:hypothetical protein
LGTGTFGQISSHAMRLTRNPTACRAFRDGASRTRTGDLLGAIQALSQLSYSPCVTRALGARTEAKDTRRRAAPQCRVGSYSRHSKMPI